MSCCTWEQKWRTLTSHHYGSVSGFMGNWNGRFHIYLKRMLSLAVGTWYFAVQACAVVQLAAYILCAQRTRKKDASGWSGRWKGSVEFVCGCVWSRCRDFLKETEAVWRRPSYSEGLHHLADLGKHFIWWPLSINLSVESEGSELQWLLWHVHAHAHAHAAPELTSTGQNTISPLIKLVQCDDIEEELNMQQFRLQNNSACFQPKPLYWSKFSIAQSKLHQERKHWNILFL